MPASFSVELAGSCYTLLTLLASLELTEGRAHVQVDTGTTFGP